VILCKKSAVKWKKENSSFGVNTMFLLLIKLLVQCLKNTNISVNVSQCCVADGKSRGVNEEEHMPLTSSEAHIWPQHCSINSPKV